MWRGRRRRRRRRGRRRCCCCRRRCCHRRRATCDGSIQSCIRATILPEILFIWPIVVSPSWHYFEADWPRFEVAFMSQWTLFMRSKVFRWGLFVWVCIFVRFELSQSGRQKSHSPPLSFSLSRSLSHLLSLTLSLKPTFSAREWEWKKFLRYVVLKVTLEAHSELFFSSVVFQKISIRNQINLLFFHLKRVYTVHLFDASWTWSIVKTY